MTTPTPEPAKEGAETCPFGCGCTRDLNCAELAWTCESWHAGGSFHIDNCCQSSECKVRAELLALRTQLSRLEGEVTAQALQCNELNKRVFTAESRLKEVEAERDGFAVMAADQQFKLKLADMFQVVRYALSLHRPDAGDAITEEWLQSLPQFSQGSLFYTMLLPPKSPIAAIACLSLSLVDDEWCAGLRQGVPDDPKANDDHVELTSVALKTRGDLRALVRGLGITLQEQPDGKYEAHSKPERTESDRDDPDIHGH